MAWWGAPNPGRLLNAIADRLLPPVQLPAPKPPAPPRAGPQMRTNTGGEPTIFEAGFGVTHNPDDTACPFAEYLRRETARS